MQQLEKLFIEFGFEQGGWLLPSLKAYIYIEPARNLQLDWVQQRFTKCRFDPGKRIKENGSPDSLTIWFPNLETHETAISEINRYLERTGWERSAGSRLYPNIGESTYRRTTSEVPQTVAQGSVNSLNALVNKWEMDARRSKERSDNKESSMSPDWLQGAAYGYEMAATELKEFLQKMEK
jgi:hypothetical protein